MGAYPAPADAGVGTGLSAAIFFAFASRRKKGFPLQSLARKTDIPPGGIPLSASRYLQNHTIEYRYKSI
jgi:hypothetical protein